MWNDLWPHLGAGSLSLRANKRIQYSWGSVKTYDILSWLVLQLVEDVFLIFSPKLERCPGLLSCVPWHDFLFDGLLFLQHVRDLFGRHLLHH